MSFMVLALIIFTVTLSACAQLALKMGADSPALKTALSTGIVDAVTAALLSPLIWTGLIIYGLSVALWVWVLSKVDLSIAYPFVGISFLITMAFGAFILDESVTNMRIIGTLLIAGGCVLVAQSA